MNSKSEFINKFITYVNAKNIKEKDMIDLKDVYTRPSYLAKLLSAYIDIEHGNILGATQYLKQLISIPSHFLSLEISEYVAIEKRKEFKEVLIDVLTKIWDAPIDENVKNIYFDSLQSLNDADIQEIQDGFFGDLLKTKSNFSLTDYKYSISFAKYWLEKLQDDDLKLKLLREYFLSPAFITISLSEFDIFSLQLPSDEKRRNLVVDKLIGNWDNLNYYEREASFVALENNVLKKVMLEKDKRFLAPLFTLKKNSYKKYYEEGFFQVYYLLKLFEIGHEDKAMLDILL